MKQTIMTEKMPIKLWLDDIEAGALIQAENIANLPFIFKHIAIMPDAHQGYGMPIGGVMASHDVVVPNAVGVDIGCGVCAILTYLRKISINQIKAIVGRVREDIPVGFNRHKEPQHGMPVFEKNMPIVVREYDKARHQIGTLGGGNHFIEIQKGLDGYIWLMIHSGSRNLGKQVADHYHQVAKALNKAWFSKSTNDLAFLPIDSDEGQAYLKEMYYCVKYARANREAMMGRVEAIVDEVCGGVSFGKILDVAHNYAAMEHHFGKNVLVHRKGATRAREGELGIIPGSQGTASYIVKGRGNPESFMSCSHGAGRKMGRKEAQRSLDLADEQKRLNDMGIVHSIRGVKDLDEAAGAYKDISIVMANQTDLVEIEVELKPLGVVKG